MIGIIREFLLTLLRVVTTVAEVLGCARVVVGRLGWATFVAGKLRCAIADIVVGGVGCATFVAGELRCSTD